MPTKTLHRPLLNKRIVVTRAAVQAASFIEKLKTKGAQVFAYPCIEIIPPQNLEPFENALNEMAAGKFDWLILTSSNAVEALVRHVKSLPENLKIAAVGPGTANTAKELLNATVHLSPVGNYEAEELALYLEIEKGARIFLPHSRLADSRLCQHLSMRGANVTEVISYDVATGSGGVDLPSILSQIDTITLTSASCARNLLERFKTENGNILELLKIPVVCIGEKTATAAREMSFKNIISAAQQTLDSMIATLENYFNTNDKLR